MWKCRYNQIIFPYQFPFTYICAICSPSHHIDRTIIIIIIIGNTTLNRHQIIFIVKIKFAQLIDGMENGEYYYISDVFNTEYFSKKNYLLIMDWITGEAHKKNKRRYVYRRALLCVRVECNSSCICVCEWMFSFRTT